MESKTWVLFSLLLLAGVAHCQEVVESPTAPELVLDETVPQEALNPNEIDVDDQDLKTEDLLINDPGADDDDDADDETASRQSAQQTLMMLQNLRRRVEVQRWLFRRSNSALALEILELTAILRALRRVNYQRIRQRDGNADSTEVQDQAGLGLV